MFIFFVSLTIILGLIYANLQKQSNEILSEIRELKKEIHSCYRGVEMDFRGIEYKIDELKKALKAFNQKTKDRITIEYILIGGLNDTKDCALELIELLSDIKCNINLIPYNPVCDNNNFKKPNKKDMMRFKYLLEATGKKVTIRLERGADIDAACGQLAGKSS